MHKVSTGLKLPKIDEFNSQKSQPYLISPKDSLPSLHSPNKGLKDKTIRSSGIFNHGLESPQKRGFSSDKVNDYNEQPDANFFMNSQQKQTWMLKKLEAQRETLQKKPQFLGLRDAPQYRPGPERDSPLFKRKFQLDETSTSKSMNLGSAKLPRGKREPTYHRSPKNEEFETEVNDSDILEPIRSNSNGATPKALKQAMSNRLDKPRLNSLTPIDDPGHNSEPERMNGKVNLDLLVKIDEKIHAIFENSDNKMALLPHIKEYLEAIEPEEAIQVETLFFDTRMRRNLKTYLMLEKTALFTLLYLVTEDSNPKDVQEMQIRNICHYTYNNYLNFLETLISKLDFLPRYSHAPAMEKLKQTVQKNPHEVDRSFGLEQINKLLLKVLRVSLKCTTKKGDRFPKADHLLEKIEFGLMLNYFAELKEMFNDLTMRHKINIRGSMSEAPPVESTAPAGKKKTIVRPERTKSHLGTSSRLNPIEGISVKTPENKESFLPPPVPKAGQEDKPFYTLVLDMDETLIHFEEVAGKGRFFVRPYAEKFLKEMSEIYELVIFTAGVKEYADAVLNILDPNNYITHRLYRHHTTLKPTQPGVIKDLTKIGRDLTKTMIIDNAPENFRLQIDNGLEITSWYNDPYDTELLDFIPFLRDLVHNQVEDVRKSVKKYKQTQKKKKF